MAADQRSNRWIGGASRYRTVPPSDDWFASGCLTGSVEVSEAAWRVRALPLQPHPLPLPGG
jgi:hypothetical protein